MARQGTPATDDDCHLCVRYLQSNILSAKVGMAARVALNHCIVLPFDVVDGRVLFAGLCLENRV